MADISDVEEALVDLIVSATYPGGPGSACVVAGVSELNVFRGWPDAPTEDSSIEAGAVNASVYTVSGMTRNMTRYLEDFRDTAFATPTLTAQQSGDQVTFSGTGGPGQLAGVVVLGQAYSVQAAGTPGAIAAALAALVPGAQAQDGVLTVPGLELVRVGASVTQTREVRRQSQGFRITLWCPSPETRDAAASAIDAALAAYDEGFILLRDGTQGLLKYSGTFPDDSTQKSGIYRRDLRYTVEYPIIQIQVVAPILFPHATVTRLV